MRAWVFPVVLVCTVGCKGSSSPKVVGTGATTTATIGPEGGQISLEGAALTIPAGALAAPVDIKVTSSAVAVPKFEMATPLYVFEPDGLEFAQPVTITMTAPAALKATTMLLSTVHAGGPDVTWFQDLHGTASGQTITGTMNHFSGVVTADMLRCDETQEVSVCSRFKCGDHVALEEDDVVQKFTGLVVPVALPDECVCHCGPCDTPSEAPVPPEDIIEIVGDLESGFESPKLDAVACDTWSASFLNAPFKVGADSAANGHTFRWSLNATTSVITEDNVPIYQGTVPMGTSFSFGYFGVIPTMTLTGLDPMKNPGTLTVSGPFSCPGTFIPMASQTGTSGAAGSNGSGGAGNSGHAPPTILSVLPVIGSPGDIVVLHGMNLGDGTGDDKVTFSGVDGSKGIMYNGYGGDVGVVVPDGPTNGTITWTNKWGTGSWSGTFQVNYKPTITSMTPASPAPGAMVTFVGTHLENLDTTAGLFIQTSQLLVSGSRDPAPGPLTVVDGQHATATMPGFSEPPDSMVTDCSATLWLADKSAGTAGERQSDLLMFTVSGAGPDCP